MKNFFRWTSWTLWVVCLVGLVRTVGKSELWLIAIYVLGSICYGGFCMLQRE